MPGFMGISTGKPLRLDEGSKASAEDGILSTPQEYCTGGIPPPDTPRDAVARSLHTTIAEVGTSRSSANCFSQTSGTPHECRKIEFQNHGSRVWIYRAEPSKLCPAAPRGCRFMQFQPRLRLACRPATAARHTTRETEQPHTVGQFHACPGRKREREMSLIWHVSSL